MLLLTGFICLLLGIGMPTTANYVVVATLMAPVVVNCETRRGKQIVASNDNYGLRHRLLPN